MKLPITVTFHGPDRSDWIENEVRARAARLDVYCPDIMSCHVTVDVSHRHHTKGNRFSLRTDLRVAGEEIAVTRASNIHASRRPSRSTREVSSSASTADRVGSALRLAPSS